MTDFLEDRNPSGQGGQTVWVFLFYPFLDEQVYRKHVDGKLLLCFDNVMISSSVSVSFKETSPRVRRKSNEAYN